MKDPGRRLLGIYGFQRRLASALTMTVFWLSACVPDPLDVDDLDFPETQIVVSSLILPDRSVAILLTRSIAALEASEESDPRELISEIAINDAQVTITTNDSVYTLPLLRDGIYQRLGIPLVPGRTCHLNVVSNSLGEVSATTVVQVPIYFDTVRVERYMTEHNDYGAQVTYTIKDPPAPNYYLLNVQEVKRKDFVENILKPQAYTRRVEDKTFDDQEFSEMFRAMNKNFDPGDSIEVSLSNVGLDYFNYVKVRLENNLELVEVFSEPVYYPTNILGGRGFFTLHLTDTRVIVF